ncbi:MAG: site-2 protease family protein [Chloroflexi bacterium]|nr:site-2 protease family protein [Chloroflexota bacterium]
MPGSIPVGRLLGVPLRIDLSWFIIFGIVTLSLVLGQFPAQYPFWSQSTYVIVGVATSLLFFGSVVVHELAHSLVARVIGIPVKSITLFIFGGVAQISRDAARPAGELVMAAAGPLSSFLLAGLFLVLWALSRPWHEPTSALAGWLAGINLSLGAFNLMPGFPMDGGRVLRSLLWWATGNQRTATRIAVVVGRGIALLFLLGGIALIVTSPRNMFSGLWLAFIGWFLNQAAGGSARQARLKDALQGYTAGNLMVADPPFVSQDATIQQFVEEYVGNHIRPWALVVQGPHLRGLVNLFEVRRVPQRRWNATPVAEIMTPAHKLSLVTPQMEAVEVLEEMEDREVLQLPVVEGGLVVGVVTRNGILRAADIRQDLRF